MDANDRFEAIGRLYYQHVGRLRPGKDVAAGAYAGEDARKENEAIFSRWLQVHAFDFALAEIERLRAQLHEVREIYAGMDGFIPLTAPEGYCLQTLKQMYNAAKEKRDE